MSITENKERIGAFTSSNIYKLLGSKRVRETYILEKQIEKRMGRSISVEAYSRAMAWGTFMEMFVFDKIGLEYKITSNDTDVHPQISGWSGSKDLIVPGVKISDIKCYQPKNFALYTDAILTKNISVLRDNFPKEYYQLVSNAIINKVPNAEAITFMPLKSELDELREFAEAYEGSDAWKYRFIYESDDCDLPYLPNNGYYESMNTFEFEVPEYDITLLTNAVLTALNEL